MDPVNLAQALEELILAANGDYLLAISEIERKLFRQIILDLQKLEVDSEGYIIQSADNRKIIQKADGDFNDIVKSPSYVKALDKYVGTIPAIDAMNEQYFAGISAGFKVNRVFMKQIRQETIKSLETLILREGLDTQVRLQLQQIITQGINTGASYDGMYSQVKEFILGDQEGGRLKNYVTTLTRDALFNYSRAFQQSATADLGLEFYFFSGGLQAKSRDFCIDRVDKIFHQKEVEQWAKLDWPGKRKGTTEASIFVYAGGYNCTHSLIPVDISIVPTFVIERVIKKGFYKKAA